MEQIGSPGSGIRSLLNQQSSLRSRTNISGIRAAPQHRLGSLDNHSYLPADIPTYYKRLRDNGYYAGCAGKFDLAKPHHYNRLNGDRPCCFSWGFTHPVECEGKMHAGSRPEPFGPYTNYLNKKGLLKDFYADYQKRKKERVLPG